MGLAGIDINHIKEKYVFMVHIMLLQSITSWQAGASAFGGMNAYTEMGRSCLSSACAEVANWLDLLSQYGINAPTWGLVVFFVESCI